MFNNSEKKHLNKEMLLAKLGGNDIYLREILHLGNLELIRSKSLIEDCVKTKDFVHLKGAFHHLKGTASSIGFEKLLDYLLELEKTHLFTDEIIINSIINEIDFLKNE
jgi:hypothetical protein